MKKIMKKFILIITILLVFPITTVYAGSCNVSVNSPDKVTLGADVDVTLRVSDIVGFDTGLMSSQGELNYDNSYLEYQKKSNGDNGLSSSFGTKNNKYVVAGYGGEYIAGSGNLITLTFKTLKLGKTTVGLSNVKVVDTKSVLHTATVHSKEIEIVEASDTQSTPTTPSTNDSTKKEETVKDTSTQKTTSNKSSDNYLLSLIVNDAKMIPSFNKNITSYSVTVPGDIDKLNLNYQLSSSKAKDKVVGNENLKEGENVVEIIVTAENGSRRIYTLNVTKSKLDSSNKLKSLDVKESNLSPKFDPDTNVYTIKVKKNIKKLTIDAIAKDKNATVEIIDNNDLDKGNGVVLIKVTDKNGFSNYYKLKVNDANVALIFGIPILRVLYFLIGLLFILLLFIFFLKKKSDHKVAKGLIDLYDDMVTPEEIVYGFKAYALENDPSILKLLINQNNTNKEKEKVAKNDLVEAMAEGDSEKIKSIKKEIADMKGNMTEEDELLRDDLIKAITDENPTRIKELIRIIRGRH